jgi:hypothetical protein
MDSTKAGSVDDAWTSATIRSEVEIVAINQLMATVCISQPRLETCVDSQIERKIGFRSGANVAGGTEALAALTRGLILPGHNPLTLQCARIASYPGLLQCCPTGTAHIPGHDRSQTLLLPESVDDYVSSDNPVRLIDAFVDKLDLVAAGFDRTVAEATGRTGYAAADLLKLYIYGYVNRGSLERFSG